MIKKIISLFLALILGVNLTGCQHQGGFRVVRVDSFPQGASVQCLGQEGRTPCRLRVPKDSASRAVVSLEDGKSRELLIPSLVDARVVQGVQRSGSLLLKTIAFPLLAVGALSLLIIVLDDDDEDDPYFENHDDDDEDYFLYALGGLLVGAVGVFFMSGAEEIEEEADKDHLFVDFTET